MAKTMNRKGFPSDLTDAQWQTIEPMIPAPKSGGRRRRVNVREVVNAVLYLEATGCGWRGLPESFPHRSTVWSYLRIWRSVGVWDNMVAMLKLTDEPAHSDVEG